MNAVTEAGLNTPLGIILNCSQINWMLANHKYRSAYLYIDREKDKIEWSENDPAFVPLTILTSFCLYKCGLYEQADATLDFARARLSHSEYSPLARVLDQELSRMFPKEDPPALEEYPEPENWVVSLNNVLC
jgi:hypothetical protein